MTDGSEDDDRHKFPSHRAQEHFECGEYEAAADDYTVSAHQQLGEWNTSIPTFEQAIDGTVLQAYRRYFQAISCYRLARVDERARRRAREAVLVLEDLRDNAFQYIIQRAACEEYIGDLRVLADLPGTIAPYRRAAAGYGMAEPDSYWGWRKEDCLELGERTIWWLAEAAGIELGPGDLTRSPHANPHESSGTTPGRWPGGFRFETRARWKRDNLPGLVDAFLAADRPDPL